MRYAARGDEADLDQAIDLVTSPWRESRPASTPRRRSKAAAGAIWLPCCGAAMKLAATRPTWRLPRGCCVTGFGHAAAQHRHSPAGRAGPCLAGHARRHRRRTAAQRRDQRIPAALAATGPKAPVRATYLDNLGMALLDRYERSGAIDDADESVRLLRLAREATPRRSPAFAGVLNNWRAAGPVRHRPADLPEALAAFEQRWR